MHQAVQSGHTRPMKAVLVLEGEEHKTGHDDDSDARFTALERWGADHLGMRSVAIAGLPRIT
jgi:hypothetical protein